MPQKRNPDAAELMRAAGPRWPPTCRGCSTTLHGLPLAYDTDLREDKRYLFDAVDCLDALLPVVRELLAGVEFDTGAWPPPATGSLMATDVADRWSPPACPSARPTMPWGRWCARALELGVGLDALPSGESAALAPARRRRRAGEPPGWATLDRAPRWRAR